MSDPFAGHRWATERVRQGCYSLATLNEAIVEQGLRRWWARRSR